MKLSPLDIRHKEFQSALNGFNKGQVRDFLARAADQFEERLEQIQQLSEQIKKQEKEIEELRVSDIELKRTLVTSERLTGEVKLQAEREAELLLKESQSKAEVILRDAELQKRQLLKTAELQIEEANAARQKAEKAAKQIRERSIQEAALQNKRANNMVAGLKEDLNLETKHAQELEQLRTKSKTVIGQLKQDIAKLKTERGQMVEKLSNYDKNLAELEHKVASKSEPAKQPKPTRKPERPKRRSTDAKGLTKAQSYSQNSTSPKKLRTRQVANALSNSIDSLMSNNFLSDSLLPENKLGLSSSPKPAKRQVVKKRSASAHDITYPKMVKTQAKQPKQANLRLAATDPMNITVTPLLDDKSPRQDIGRYSRERKLEKEHLSAQQVHFVEDTQDRHTNNNDTSNYKTNGLSQHVYPDYPVEESSIQDRGRLITPPTVYDVENPFIDDGFDELDSLGTFSEAMLQKDTPSNIRGVEFDSNIFDVEDTLELPSVTSTVERIEVLDTEWFDNFELEDD